MIKTKIKKALAITAMAAIVTTQSSVFAASTIGQGTVIGDAAFDTNIVWDDLFPGSASGTVSGIEVQAQVLPTLNMSVSASEINLGVLTAGIAASGNIDIEIGTNAANGVSVRAVSGNGGLTNSSDAALQINNLSTDGSAESYTFASTGNAADSTVTGFVNTGDLSAIEVNNSTEMTIYNTNKPELSDGTDADVTFTVEATTNAQTAAGNYTDSIDFIVTGNF